MESLAYIHFIKKLLDFNSFTCLVPLDQIISFLYHFKKVFSTDHPQHKEFHIMVLCNDWAALLLAAALVLPGLNFSISIPASEIIFFTQRDTLSRLTARYGLIQAKESWSLSPLRGSILSLYSHKWLNIHNSGRQYFLNFSKLGLYPGRPCLSVVRSTLKQIWLSVWVIFPKDKADLICPCCIVRRRINITVFMVSLINITVFMVSLIKLKFSTGFHASFSNILVIISTSHVVIKQGLVGFWLKTPFMYCFTQGWSPNYNWPGNKMTELKADLAVFIAE